MSLKQLKIKLHNIFCFSSQINVTKLILNSLIGRFRIHLNKDLTKITKSEQHNIITLIRE